MLLIGVREENGWLYSSWNLTYRVGWQHICKAVNAVYDFYDGTQILVDGFAERNIIKISNKNEILNIDESRNMTIRGYSKIIKSPLEIVFYNQMRRVDVTVPCMLEEFKTADYQKFNRSLCQYLDSIELAMYR